MFTKNKTFLSKSKYFLLATSSIGMLASAEALAVDITPNVVWGYSQITNNNEWKSNGKNYFPQDNDNIILTANNQQIKFNKEINIGDINLYGFTSDGFVIDASNPTRKVSINNIVNVNDRASQIAVQNALGAPLAYGGNKDAKVQIRLKQNPIIAFNYNGVFAGGDQEISELTITGNDISAVDSIVLGGGSTKLTFRNAITVDAKIYSSSNDRGTIIVNDDVTFNKDIGHDGLNNHSIYGIMVDDSKSVTLKSDIYATDIVLEKDSKLIIDSSKQNISVHSGVAINTLVIMNDGDGIIQVRNTKNTITFHNDIGSRDTRVGEINIETGIMD